MENILLKKLASDCVADFFSKKRNCSVVVRGGSYEQRAFIVRAISGDLPDNLVCFRNNWNGEINDQYVVNLDEELPKYRNSNPREAS